MLLCRRVDRLLNSASSFFERNKSSIEGMFIHNSGRIQEEAEMFVDVHYNHNPEVFTSVPLATDYNLENFEFMGEEYKFSEASNLDQFREMTTPIIKERYPEWFDEQGIIIPERENYFDLYNNIMLTNFTVFSTKLSGNSDEFSESLRVRKYELDQYYFGHVLKVANLLPKDAPLWVFFTALAHDSIEDSHRHKLAKRWLQYELEEDEEGNIVENEILIKELGIDLDEYKTQKIAHEGYYTSSRNKAEELGETRALYAIERWHYGQELTNEDQKLLFEYGLGPVIVNQNKRKSEYDYKVEKIISRFIDQIKINELFPDENTNEALEFKRNVKLGIDLSTKRETMSYQKYFGQYIDLEKFDDPETNYWMTIMKMGDRLTNTRYPGNFNDDKNPLRDVQKYLRDAVKNTELLFQLRTSFSVNNSILDLFKDKPEYAEEYRNRFYGIAQLTNHNMNKILNKLRRKYSNLEFENKTSLNGSGEKVNKNLDYWFKRIETELYTHYMEGKINPELGGFHEISTVARDRSNILQIKGTLQELDEFMRGKSIYTKKEDENGYFEEEHIREIIDVYTYAATLKVKSCLFMGFEPFNASNREQRKIIESIRSNWPIMLNSKYRLTTNGMRYNVVDFLREKNMLRYTPRILVDPTPRRIKIGEKFSPTRV
jgi:hypothetical protein